MLGHLNINSVRNKFEALTYIIDNNIDLLLISKQNWMILSLLNCSYNPHQNLISNHLECLNRLIDEHSNSFDNFIFIGDFSVSTNHN